MRREMVGIFMMMVTMQETSNDTIREVGLERSRVLLRYDGIEQADEKWR